MRYSTYAISAALYASAFAAPTYTNGTSWTTTISSWATLKTGSSVGVQPGSSSLATVSSSSTRSQSGTPAPTSRPTPGSSTPVVGWGGQGSYNGSPGNWQSQQCLSDSQANQAADLFGQLIRDYSDALALDILSVDYVDWSSSVNTLIDSGADAPKDLTEATFTGRQAFMDGQGSQPNIPFTLLNVWHGCDHVSLRWMSSRPAAGTPGEAAAEPVIGNVIIETVPATDNQYGFRINTTYSEFNSGAWLVDLGLFKPNGPVTPVPA